MIVSDRHAGSLLGYDRRPVQGPWIVRVIVRRLHRNARQIAWDAVTGIDWSSGRVSVDAPRLEPLRP